MKTKTQLIQRGVLAVVSMGLVAAVAGCGGDDNENAPRKGDDNALACSLCMGETVCIDAKCEDAFPRFYSIEIGRVTFPMTKVSGGCWDEPGCGAPDPQVQIRLNGEKVGELDYADDLYEANFSDKIDLQILAGSKLEIVLQDEDLVGTDEALVCTFDPLTAEKIRGGDLSCQGNGATLSASIQVRGETSNGAL